MLTPLTRDQRASLELATAHYHQHVALAADYLTGRGVTGSLAVLYRLGVVNDPLPGHEGYMGRLCIPYLTPAGVVDIRFRCLQAHDCKEEGCPKYLGRPGVDPGLYNVGALFRPGSDIAITEGEVDAMTVDGMVGVPTVGVPGSQAWKPYWARLFADYTRVFVMCDGDEAGRSFGKTLVKHIDSAVLIHLPAGQDSNKLYMTGGADAVKGVMGL